MSDEPTPSTEPRLTLVPNAAEDGPWAIKKIPGRERQMALEAAKRRKVTMGEWLAEAIRAHVESERGESFGHAMFSPTPEGEIVPVHPAHNGEIAPMMAAHPAQSGEMIITPLSIGEIAEAIAIAERIAAIRQRPVPARLLQRAMRALSLRLHASSR